MSVFGYGSSYQPSWRQSSQPQTTQNNPTFGIAPEMARPNFNPVADSPWADREMFESGRIAGGESGQPVYSYRPWENPIEGLYDLYGFGSGDPNTAGKQWAIGGTTPNVINNQADSNVGNMKFDMSTNAGQGLKGGTSANPQDVRELYNSIQGLSLDQMMRMSGGISSIGDRFGNISRNYANAYANKFYEANSRGETPYGYGVGPGWDGNVTGGAAQMSQGQTTDYLQKAYDSTMSQMNNAFLL